ncbi:ATP/DNA-binding protein [Spatholobus suberectus]|nr:ATP/DNA-binding protein [Spatholobus suberectus]
MLKYGEACEFIGRQLMNRAASFALSKGHVLLILEFIQYLRKSLLPADKFVNSIRGGSWLRTSRGYRSPVGSVMHDLDWRIASQISDIPFIDQAYYGGELYHFKEELQLLGVIVGFSRKVVIEHLKSLPYLKSLSAETVVLTLECMLFVDVSDKLVNTLKGTSCEKRSIGFKTPGECFLLDPVWGCILNVFNDFPMIDHKFYGDKMFPYKTELKQTGVGIDFEEAIKAFSRVFKQKASQASFNKHHVESFLSCFRRLKETDYKFPLDFLKIMRSSKWLQTRVGDYRSPGECILFGPDWESLSLITRLPFIDDIGNCYG